MHGSFRSRLQEQVTLNKVEQVEDGPHVVIALIRARQKSVTSNHGLWPDVRKFLLGKTAKPKYFIDDKTGRTLCAVSSTAKNLADALTGKKKTERAAIIGAEIAKRASDAGGTQVVFDRGFSKYHGRVKALADAAREGGLKF